MYEEGQGSTVVFVHGTPSYSFEFRDVMRILRDRYRCVAFDHLGFGLSDKNKDADFSIAAHQQRFSEVMNNLAIQDVVLVLHDFGTSIALPWMLRNPDKVRGVILANTFLWTMDGMIGMILRFYSTGFGRWLYRVANLSAKYLLPYAWGKKKPLTKELHAEYLAPFVQSKDRFATAALPGELFGRSLKELTPKMKELDKWPVRAVWGMADPMVGPEALARWKEALPNMKVEEVPKAGHFVAEESPESIAHAVNDLWETADDSNGRTYSAPDVASASAF